MSQILQNVQFYRQQANGNHMSAQHYSIEYREGGTCVHPFKHLLCIRKKTRMTVYHFNNQNHCNTKISGINTIFPILMC